MSDKHLQRLSMYFQMQSFPPKKREFYHPFMHACDHHRHQPYHNGYT
jgi:hypothetical protein